jgi:hypothetical protein
MISGCFEYVSHWSARTLRRPKTRSCFSRVPQSRVASQEVIKMLGTNVNPEARNVDAAQQWRKGHDHDCGDRNKIGPRTLRHETYKRGLTTPETCGSMIPNPGRTPVNLEPFRKNRMSKSQWAFRPAVLTRATKAAEKKTARVWRKWSATCGFRPTLICIKECREKLLSISNTRGWW